MIRDSGESCLLGSYLVRFACLSPRPRHGSTAPTTPELAALANIGMLAMGTGRAEATFTTDDRFAVLWGDSRCTLTVSIWLGHC